MLQFYPSEYHNLYSSVRFVSMIVGGLMSVILLMSVTSCILEGNNSRQILLAVETASVVQLTYFSLLGVGELNPLFIALADGLKLSCGFDIDLNNQQTDNRVLLGVGIQSTNILDNVNVSLVLPVIFTFIGLICMIISRIKQTRNIKDTA